MKKVLIPLCLVVGCQTLMAQRTQQFVASDRLFKEGKELFQLKNYPGCTDKLAAFKKESRDADLIQEADYMLAYAAYEQGAPDAIRQLQDYLDSYPATRHEPEVCFLIASAYFAEDDYEETINWLQKSDIDMLTPQQQEAYTFRLAYSLLQTGGKDEARGYFSRIEEIGSEYRQAASYYVAYIDYSDGRYREALVEFNRLKEDPLYKEHSLYYITQIHYIQNKYSEVVKSGRELLNDYPDSEGNTEIYRIMGSSYYHLGNEEKAIEMLSRYVGQSEHPLRGDLYVLGICYYNAGEYKQAVKMLSQSVTEDDVLTQNAYLYLGQAYLKLNDKNNARMAFEAAATSSYDKGIKEVAMYNYALLIHETSFTGFGESVTIFEDFLNDFPNSKYADKVNDYLVEVYLTTKDYESAIRSIDKIRHPSVKILEAKQDVLFQLGTQAFANMKIKDAIDLFSEAISLGAYDEEARNKAYYWRGESYYRQENYRLAISDYKTYQNNTREKTSDMYDLSFYNLGYCYFKLKDYETAHSYFNQYVEKTNQNPEALADAYNRIGDCFYQNRQYTEAEENYSNAVKLQPSAGDYSVYQKGFLLGLQKDYQGKVEMMDRLVNEFPQSQYVDDALFEKGRAYVMMENNGAASQTFEHLMRQYPQSSLARKAGIQLGLIYFNQNESAKAIEAYKYVIDKFPGSEESRVALQDLKSVYIDMNDVTSYVNYVNSLGGNVHIEVTEQDSLTYIAAEKLFLRGDNEGARNSLMRYLADYPQGAFSSNANYYLGSIAFAEKDYDAAKGYYANVIASGDTKFMEESVARSAEIAYMKEDYSGAMELYRKLSAIAESPENMIASRLGVMRSALKTEQQTVSLESATELLKLPKLSPEVETEARYVRVKAYLGMKDAKNALPDLKILSKDTRTAQGAEAKYLLAQLYYDMNDDKNAEAVLDDFAKNGTPHQYWLARGFILWADIYIRQGDKGQARVYLNSLQNNYEGDDDIADMIEERLEQIK